MTEADPNAYRERPASGQGPDGKPGLQGIPWESEGNMAKAFFETWAMVTFKPRVAFALPAAPGVMRPVLFALIVAVFFLLAGYILNLGGLAEGGVFFGAVFGTFIVLAFGLPTGALWLTLFFTLFRRQAGFQTVFRVLCYSYAAMALHLIPFIGKPLALGFTVYILIMGLAATLKTSPINTWLPVILAGLTMAMVFAAIVFTLSMSLN